MEQGKFEPTEEGSAQGSAMSPMLANIYMHDVLTLCILQLVVQREMQGECCSSTLRMILLQDFNISQKLKDTIKS